MALKIKNAILHIMLSKRDSLYSHEELDFGSEIAEGYILKHVRRLLNNPAARQAVFAPQSDVYAILRDYSLGQAHFKDTSRAIAKKFEACMKANEGIPEHSMLIAHVRDGRNEYMAVVLLGYQNVYAHKTTGEDNQLTMYRSLPASPGKVGYAALFGLHGAQIPINLVELTPAAAGISTLFFSGLFLQCETQQSKKECADLLSEVCAEFVETHFDNSPKVTSAINTAFLADVASGEGIVSLDNVAGMAFDEVQVQKQFASAMQQSGVADEMDLGERVIKSRFAIQKLKSESGIEIRFPTQLAQDEIEFTTHPDGSVSVLLKNLLLV